MSAMMIDVEQLREDLLQNCYGGFFGGGFGAALIEAAEVEKATLEELVELAQRQGINLSRYSIE